jgi:hypothetical protein
MGSHAWHGDSVKKYERAGGKYSGINTPYKFKVTPAGWHITFGASGFNVALGAPAFIQQGKALYRHLESEWLVRNRRKKEEVN